MVTFARPIDGSNSFGVASNTSAEQALQLEHEPLYGDAHRRTGLSTCFFKLNMAVAPVLRSYAAIEKRAFGKFNDRGRVWN